jgi:hypothetical protein
MWLKAIKAGNFVGWQLLTEKNVNKYCPVADETAKGHMNQTRKNVRSTKENSYHSNKPMPQLSEARRYKTFMLKSTTFVKPSFPIKPVNSPPAPSAEKIRYGDGGN